MDASAKGVGAPAVQGPSSESTAQKEPLSSELIEALVGRGLKPEELGPDSRAASMWRYFTGEGRIDALTPKGFAERFFQLSEGYDQAMKWAPEARPTDWE